jgi:hypothetical protein
MRLVLVSYDPLHAVTVETLVYAVAIGEEFSHDHWLRASNAFERSTSSFVD